MEAPDIIVTSSDFERLQRLIETHTADRDQDAVELLDVELSRARVVPPSEVPPSVVTMNSRLRYVNQATGASRTVTLVYPAEANFEAGRLSILTPVGCALLGLAVGQTIDWTMPNRQMRKFVVEELLYQPEAAGDLHL